MNYRHSYHAGNVGDVLKHALLIALIRALQQKESALTIIDTHAGRGLYDLEAIEATKTQEAAAGIKTAWHSHTMLLAPYLQLVAAFNPPETLRYYPGSPALLTHLARAQDVVVVNEYHPEEATALRQVFSRDQMVQIHNRDGYELWPALVPPKTPRGLVFVDPPFEARDEFNQIIIALQTAHKKFAHGVTAIWYPIKDRAQVWQWEEMLAQTGIEKIYQAEHVAVATERPEQFNGSGLFIINPPFAFVEAAPALLEAIKTSCGNAGNTTARWLAE